MFPLLQICLHSSSPLSPLLWNNWFFFLKLMALLGFQYHLPFWCILESQQRINQILLSPMLGFPNRNHSMWHIWVFKTNFLTEKINGLFCIFNIILLTDTLKSQIVNSVPMKIIEVNYQSLHSSSNCSIFRLFLSSLSGGSSMWIPLLNSLLTLLPTKLFLLRSTNIL